MEQNPNPKVSAVTVCVRERDMDPDQPKASHMWETLRREPVNEWLAGEILRCLPTSYLLHPRFKKALILRRLSSGLACSLFSEDTLQCLELLEELDRSAGAAGPPRVLSSAYCAVAAELTVAPLRRMRNDCAAAEAGFFDMVQRFWKCRMADLEQSEARGMVGEDLRRWRGTIEHAVGSKGVRESLMWWNTKREAAEAVREYLRVALKEMAPQLRELVETAASGGGNDARGGMETGPSGGEMLTPAGPSGESSERRACVSTGGPVDELAPPTPATGTGGGRGVPETGADKTNELAGQTGEFVNTDRACGQLTLSSPSAEVNKAKEALESSCEELQWVVVEDPLPEALERAAHVVETSAVNPSDAYENQQQTETGASEPGPSGRKDVQGTVLERKGDGKGHSGRILRRRKPSHDMMHATPQTYEGGEGSDGCPDDRAANTSKRTRSSTGNQGASSLKLQENSKFVRRKTRWWIPQEEDALREAIKKHGKGNWKRILQSNPGTFKDRTEVDLKDKWRNMTR